MTSVWFKWRSATRRKQKSWYSLSPSSPSLAPSPFLPDLPSRHHLNPAEICNHYRVTAWHTMTRQNIHLTMFYFSEEPNCRKKISKLFQGLEGDQTFLACPLTRPLIYNGLVRARLDSVCLKTYRGFSIAQAHHHLPHGERPFVPKSLKCGLQHGTMHPCEGARE